MILIFSRFRSRLSSADFHKHPALYPKPEGDWQPAQAYAAIENNRLLGNMTENVQGLWNWSKITAEKFTLYNGIKPPNSSQLEVGTGPLEM